MYRNYITEEDISQINREEDISQISKNVERAKKEYLGKECLVLVAHHHWHEDNTVFVNHSILAAKMTNIVVNSDTIIDWAKCYDDNKHKLPTNPKCYVFDISFFSAESTVEMFEFEDNPMPLFMHLQEILLKSQLKSYYGDNLIEKQIENRK